MKINNAKELISAYLSEAKGMLGKIGVSAETNLADEITEGDGYIYGALVVGGGMVKDDECIFFPTDIEIKGGEANESELQEAKADLIAKIGALCAKLEAAEDKAKAIALFGEEIQKTREMELLGQMKDLEKDTSKNLKLALSAGAVMLFLAAICIIISKLL